MDEEDVLWEKIQGKLLATPGLTDEEKTTVYPLLVEKGISQAKGLVIGPLASSVLRRLLQEREAAAAEARQGSGAAAGTSGAAATVEREYMINVVGQRKTKPHKILAAFDVSLVDLVDLIAERVPAMAHVDFVVVWDGRDMNAERWEGALNRIDITTPMALQVRSTAVAFSSQPDLRPSIQLQDMARNLLGVRTTQGTPREAPATDFPLLEVASDVPIPLSPASLPSSLDEVLEATTKALQLRVAVSQGVSSMENDHRAYIDLVLVASVLAARAAHPSDAEEPLSLVPECPLIGRKALGKADWALVYRTLAVLVAEAKPGNLDAAWVQLYLELSAMRDSLRDAASVGKKRSHFQAFDLATVSHFAVLCSAEEWRVVEYNEAVASKSAMIKQSPPMRLSLSKTTSFAVLAEEVRKVVLTLAHVLVKQMAVLDEVIKRHPNICGAPTYDKDALRLVELAELQAKEEKARKEDEARDDGGGLGATTEGGHAVGLEDGQEVDP